MDSFWMTLKHWEETIGLFPTLIAAITLLFTVIAAVVGLISLWQARTRKKRLDVQVPPPVSPPQSSMQQPTHVWNVPFQRNPFFTGREAVLEGIHASFSQHGMAAISQAVAGMGGIGKTQTAVEYAYRYGSEYSAVLWTGAEKEEDIISGFVQIATLLGLPEAGCPDSQVAVGAVMQWLADNGNWLLVFDNADDPALLEGYMNPAYQGHILITSRADHFDMLNITAPARLEVLPPEDALAFLLKRAECTNPSEAQRDAARAVAERLGYFPLALEQAGAFVLARRCSFADYLAEYENKGVALLGEQGRVIGEYPNTVLTTWAVNFAQVEEKSPAAAGLLRVCAFLAPEPIPYRLIIEGAEHFGSAVQAVLGEEISNLSVSTLLAPLADFSLVEINPEAHAFTLHRLVQEAVRYGLGKDREREFAERGVRAVNTVFPKPEVENWPWCEVLLPHALTCDEHIEGFGIVTKAAGRLLNESATYAYHRARYALAIWLYQRTSAIYEKLFGPEHPKLATSLNNLALLYETTGRLSEAEPLYHRAVEIDTKVYGPDHPEVATDLNNLAVLYSNMGRKSDAEPLCQRALTIREKILGPEHPSTATSLNNLANLYRETNRLSEAEPLYRRVIAIVEKVLGPEHPLMAASLNNLAIFYHDIGRLTEAEPLLRRAMIIDEKLLGPEHPDTGIDYHNLGRLLQELDRDAEAQPFLERAAAVKAKHPYVWY